MALFRTLNTLRRDTLDLALQTLGLRSGKGPVHKKVPTLYRTFDPASTRRAAAPMAQLLMPTSLQVCALERETADAISVVLERADGQAIAFTPGMFFTVLVTIDGQEYRRAYSASSAAQDNTRLTLTVKRVVNDGVKGVVSHWLNDSLAVGDTLRVLGPSGQFVLQPDPAHARTLLLVAGGSGITPLMSITRSVLEQEPATQIHLLYANRRKKDIIFDKALAALCQQYPQRLHLTHVLESPPKAWKGEAGRLDRGTFARLLDRVVAVTPWDALEVYLCGPAPMMVGVAAELRARGLDASRLHQEQFTPAVAAADASRFAMQTVHMQTQGRTWSGTAQAGQTLLEAGLAAGAPLQYSCTLGGCGRCRVKVRAGAVDMPEPNCLTAEEKAQGYALACIARACSTVELEWPAPATH